MLVSEQLEKYPFAVPLRVQDLPSSGGFNYFRGGHWGQCLELLAHLCSYSAQLLIVVGPHGFGKTVMKLALENRGLPNLYLVDDARDLSLEQVQRLFNENDQKIVLFTKPELLDRIKHTKLGAELAEKSRIIELEPLTFQEMEKFLQHIWSGTGNINKVPCTKAELQKIYIKSRGIPGVAKKLFNNSLMEYNMTEDNPSKKSLSPFVVGLTAAIAIGLCLLALAWPSDNQKNERDLMPLPQQSLMTEVPVTEQASLEPDFDQQYQPKKIDNEQKLVELESKMLSLHDNDENYQRYDYVPDQQIDFKKNTPDVANVPNNHVAPKKIDTTLAKSNVKNDEQIILSADRKHYTLQLVAASNEQKIRDFIKNHKLSGKAHYFSSTRNGKPWYTVVYGNFDSKKAALASVDDMPRAVKDLRPWVRQYSSIQNIIKDKNIHE